MLTSSSKARCCSSQCTQKIINLRAGKPKTISAVVFDFLAYRQGARITDALFAEAA